MFIYHIVLPENWEQSKATSFYEAASLAAEGFIHCSFEEQLPAVINRYYSDVSRLAILKIDTARLVSKLVAEPSTNGELYPHIYGPINIDSVADIEYRHVPIPATSDPRSW